MESLRETTCAERYYETVGIRRREYESFIEAVIKTARAVEIPGAIGREDMRLQGFRGG
jgi:hypothetical protein